jgi:urea transport system permease protein
MGHRLALRVTARISPLTLAILGLGLLLLAPMMLSPFRLNLIARYLALAVLAVGLDVAWGFGGMLSLGHGLFFGLGAYAMGMHLKLVVSGGGLPDFMNWSGVSALPTWWRPFAHLPIALLAAVLVPALIAAALGVLVFRNRVRGAYFALLTQTLVAIFGLLLVGQQGYTGGTNGLTNFTTLAGGRSASPPHTAGSISRPSRALWARSCCPTMWCALGSAGCSSRCVTGSSGCASLLRPGDGQDRGLRLQRSACRCSRCPLCPVPRHRGPWAGGNRAVDRDGRLGRAWRAWDAAGRRLWCGPGSYAKTAFSEALPSAWLYLQGGLLVLVIVAAPRGLAGVSGRARSSDWWRPAAEPAGKAAT